MAAVVGQVDVAGKPEVNFSRVIPHPDWNITFGANGTYVRVQNDIAIVELQKPLEFSDKVRPICLLDGFKEVDGEEVHIAGWGLHEVIAPNGSVSMEADRLLRATTVNFRSYEDCRRTNIEDNKNTSDPIVSPKDVMCVGAKGRGSQQGDSGGPLMVQRNGVWYEVGINSMASASHPMDQDKYAATYTRISSYCAWILEVTKGEVKCLSADGDGDDCDCIECDC